MSLNLVALLYLIASVCFIQALKGLSHPTTSIRGNLFGMVGMAIAVLATFFTLVMSNVGATVLLVPLAVNIAIGAGANPAVFALPPSTDKEEG